MAERIRFHLDENVDPDIARALRRYGIDVTTTPEVGLRGQNDSAQLTYIRLERRVIITHDADFLRFANRNKEHPGVVYCDRSARSIGEIIRNLILIYEVLSPEDMSGRVQFV